MQIFMFHCKIMSEPVGLFFRGEGMDKYLCTFVLAIAFAVWYNIHGARHNKEALFFTNA